MSEHPEVYLLDRDQWLAINRALADASLGLQLPHDPSGVEKRPERIRRIQAAQVVLSDIYRAAKTRGNANA